MKSNIVKYLASGALALGMACAVHATPINGSIGFTGTYVQNGGTLGNLASATSMSISTVSVSSSTGDLSGSGAPVTFATPIGVNGSGPSLVSLQLWSATKGLITYSLVVTSEAQTFTSGIQLNLAGSGTLMDGTLADNTAGTWQIGFGVSGSSFTWQSTSASNLPDGGTTAMLLGAALSGLALIRRKLA